MPIILAAALAASSLAPLDYELFPDLVIEARAETLFAEPEPDLTLLTEGLVQSAVTADAPIEDDRLFQQMQRDATELTRRAR